MTLAIALTEKSRVRQTRETVRVLGVIVIARSDRVTWLLLRLSIIINWLGS
jgi:hypothetical protein